LFSASNAADMTGFGMELKAWNKIISCERRNCIVDKKLSENGLIFAK